MDIILKYVRPLWPLALLAPISVLIETWAELAQPDLMASIVDRGILGSEQDIIVPTGVKMVAIMLFGVVAGLFSIYAAGKVSYRLGADLRSDIYGRVSRMSFSDIDRLEVPSLITRLGDDVNRVQSVVQQAMRLLFRAPLMFVGSVVMALMINVDISVIIIGVMVISFGLVLNIMRRTVKMFTDLQTRRDKFTSVVQEILTGVRVTKAYTNEELERERFGEANDALSDQSILVGKTMAWMMPIVSFALNAGTILIIYFGAGQVAIGGMKVGGIMAAINYMAQIQMALMMAQHVIMSITQAKASLTRIKEVLATPTEDERDEAAMGGKPLLPFTNGDIEFHNVSFAYTVGGPNQLENISIKIGRGKTLAIMGETGSGKTTLINLIARFYEPTQGTVTINGVDLREIERADLQTHVGVVLQTSLLFSGTLRENLRMGRISATDDEIMEAAETADIADYILSQADGLDAKVEQGGKNLSGGQRQRMCIARALIMRPDILVLDDSLCALDTVTESRIRKKLASTDATKVIVSQRISSICQADNIVVLSSGRVIAQGKHDELLKTCDTYSETYLAQTR